ncbi:serine/threonine-protein kinase [Aporhodopirellula aestuarii]|uniref:Protein kinase n=1 Tax=Aporhodopirellula aestuarii TaxID=2950107 RepID=A0ABT0U0R3_9BACT|nr:serine/threonine-protein kinase [Aporhodopirellula aestuarii]MCM2370443.1 protein kinase [Aporhodopirellula aestuarii]
MNPSDPASRSHPLEETIEQAVTDGTTPNATGNGGQGFEAGSLALPMTLGRYELFKLLGKGGMGAVYQARDTLLGRDVAIKVPKFGPGVPDQLVKRFHREARAAASLSHPNLCPVFDVGREGEIDFIAMAFINGRPLSDYTRGDKAISPAAAARLIRKVALAMHEAHQSGIMHRDLKPANIMVDNRKEPIVMDFGLACSVEAGDESRLTQDGALLGSPGYMSPEQLTGRAADVGPHSDVYSLGVVLYEMLAGRLPFEDAGSTIAMIGQILSLDPPSVATFCPGLDTRLAEICERAMAKSVDERYATMSEFAADLTQYIKSPAGKPASNQPSAGSEKVPPTAAKPPQQSKPTPATKTTNGTSNNKAAAATKMQLANQPTKPGVRPAGKTPSKEHDVLHDSMFDSLPEIAAPTATAAFKGSATAAQPRGPSTAKGISRSKKRLITAIAGGLTLCLVVVGVAVTMFPGNAPQPESVSNANTPSQQRDGARSGGATVDNNERLGNQRRPRFDDLPRDAMGRGIPPERMLDFDADGDGMVAIDELPEPARELMSMADQNQDGFIDQGEIERMPNPGGFTAQEPSTSAPPMGPRERFLDGESPRPGRRPGRGQPAGNDFGPPLR